MTIHRIHLAPRDAKRLSKSIRKSFQAATDGSIDVRALIEASWLVLPHLSDEHRARYVQNLDRMADTLEHQHPNAAEELRYFVAKVRRHWPELKVGQ